MVNVLILDQHSRIARLVTQRLRGLPNFHVTDLRAADFKRADVYTKVLAHQNVIASFLGPMDVDLDVEALFDALDRVRPPLRQIVMLSHAGVDDGASVPIRCPKIHDVHEYLDEQRYAVKVVDESEIPYTILRPVTFTDRTSADQPIVVEEGRSVPRGHVSYQSVAKVAADVIAQHRYVNQSIAIID